MKIFNILILIIVTFFGITNAHPITSMFLAAFDPLALAKEAQDKLNNDISEVTFNLYFIVLFFKEKKKKS